ncbi:MAG TPA: thioredoxin domain-containing protein, partial [Longimicrobiaceae bacterium]|nr:thioredoxin domain-containing protein [Longimicrobiaceae bacterium]
LTVVEVSDFQCPFCRQFTEQTYRRFDSAYIQTGKVRLIFVHYPLPNHAEAWGAAEAAMCAGVQGKFWPMHDRLFATQQEWAAQPDAAERFAGYAQALDLDMAAYRDCTENDRVAAVLVNDILQVSSAGVQGTPTFFLGQRAMSGALTFEEISREVEAQLAGVQPRP